MKCSNQKIKGWGAPSVENATLDIGLMSSSPTLNMAFTRRIERRERERESKKEKEKKERQRKRKEGRKERKGKKKGQSDWIKKERKKKERKSKTYLYAAYKRLPSDLNSHTLKMKGWKNIYHAKGKKKKEAAVAILT